ncbi:hypothetical protein ACN4EE_02340 [Geminocystis sp. CENA526]|uniref:hypothetical protein n=1 Tax=Geminocystis sp. CENA526 TaxID=1355871 RepID=UPI003D6E77B4
MNIVLNNIEPVLINKLEIIAKIKGISLGEEIKLIVEDYINKNITKTPEELGWSEDFFDKTAGICADEPIIIDDI